MRLGKYHHPVLLQLLPSIYYHMGLQSQFNFPRVQVLEVITWYNLGQDYSDFL